MKEKIKFEDKIEDIDKELVKRRGKWQLNALSYIDFDDVCQIIRRHVFLKWDDWDQSRPLERWLNRVITNQLINLVRNNYGNVAPPCNRCPFNLWDDHCEYTPSGKKCGECSLYRDWEKSKKTGYNMKMASSIQAEEYVEKKSNSFNFDSSIDIEKFIPGFHDLMKGKLKPKAYRVYKALYIDHKDEDTVIKEMGAPNYEIGKKRLNSIKRNIIKKAKSIVIDPDSKTDIFSCNE